MAIWAEVWQRRHGRDLSDYIETMSFQSLFQAAWGDASHGMKTATPTLQDPAATPCTSMASVHACVEEPWGLEPSDLPSRRRWHWEGLLCRPSFRKYGGPRARPRSRVYISTRSSSRWLVLFASTPGAQGRTAVSSHGPRTSHWAKGREYSQTRTARL